MKLQSKLTLLFTGLLLLVAGALLLGLHVVSDIAAKDTAKNALENVVTGQLKGGKVRSYDNGVYLQIFSADGEELLTETDVFGISGLMPALVQEHEQGQVFRIDTEEAGVYCYFLWESEGLDSRGRGGKNGLQKESQLSEEETGGRRNIDKDGDKDSEKDGDKDGDSDGGDGSHLDETDGDGVWVIGILPEDSMENIMDSIMKMAWIGLPLIVLLAAFGGWIIAGRSLRHLRKITESTREISDGHDLSRRIELPPGKDEVHELADTFNEMMERLELSFEAEQQFTSDASHELRTPTTVILAECEMAEKIPDDAEAAQESIVEIHKQAKKMSEIIGKLLSYTRLEQGTRRIDREELDLSELVWEVCEEQRTVITRDIVINCENEPGIMVNGDAALLISLVQNLVSNAVKYGKEGGHVYVRVYKENQQACISVRDDGIGISEKDQDRIWNRFYQADHSRSDEKRGVGLGLSLVQQIARLHGGTVKVSSTPGQGSEFIFSMPI